MFGALRLNTARPVPSTIRLDLPPPARDCSAKQGETAMPQIKRLAAMIAIASGLAMPAPLQAQDFPNRPSPWSSHSRAAGGVDVVGRIMAARMAEILGQQVIVENVGGAGGMTGAARVREAPPDGYQFVLGNVGTHAQNQTLYKNPLYNAATDFAPVALVVDQPMMLAARKTSRPTICRSSSPIAKANQARCSTARRAPARRPTSPAHCSTSAIGVERHACPVSHRRRRAGHDRRTDRLPLPDRRRSPSRSSKASTRR